MSVKRRSPCANFCSLFLASLPLFLSEAQEPGSSHPAIRSLASRRPPWPINGGSGFWRLLSLSIRCSTIQPVPLPASTTTGRFSLSGSGGGGFAQRSFSVPAGKPLFFPLRNAFDLEVPP